MKCSYKNEQIIAHTPDGLLNISCTATLRPIIIGLKTIPSIDSLLDWRWSLMKQMETDTEYPKIWFLREIAATDHLLDLNQFDPEDIYLNKPEISDCD